MAKKTGVVSPICGELGIQQALETEVDFADVAVLGQNSGRLSKSYCKVMFGSKELQGKMRQGRRAMILHLWHDGGGGRGAKKDQESRARISWPIHHPY